MSRSVVNSLIIIIVLVGSCQMACGAKDQRVALVIGNGSYKDAPLRNPVNDAEDIEELLGRLGFQVTKLLNATQREIEQAINAFGRKLRDGGWRGTVLFRGSRGSGKWHQLPDSHRGRYRNGRRRQVRSGQCQSGVEQDAGCRQSAEHGVSGCLPQQSLCPAVPVTRTGAGPMVAPRGSFVAYATAPGDVAAVDFYKYDENSYPLRWAGWEFFNPER